MAIKVRAVFGRLVCIPTLAAVMAGCTGPEGTEEGIGWIEGMLVAIGLLILWILIARPKRVIRQGHPEHDNAEYELEEEEPGTTSGGAGNGDDPRDTPGPTIYGEEIDDAPKKYILLIAGEMVQPWVVVNKGWDSDNWPDLAVIPASQANAAWAVVTTINAQAQTAAAWNRLVARYSLPLFVDAGWELETLRAFSRMDIDNALDVIKALNPVGLAVHYVGHGDFDYSFGLTNPSASVTDPYLAIRGVAPLRLRLTDPTGATRTFGVSVPSGNTVAKHYIKDLAPKLVQDFPSMPLTLVIDACGNAQALDHKQGHLNMVVAVDRLYCGTNLGMFSSIYSGNVVPACYDAFPASMPGVVATVNTTLGRTPVSYAWAPAYRWPHKVNTLPPQQASTTTWRYPW